MQDLSEHIIWPEHASLHACTICACMPWPISQPKWVGSERWRHLWNWENILDLSEYIIQTKHTMSLHVQAHISDKLVWIRESRYLWNQENMLDLSEHMIWPEHASLQACTLFACMLRPISQPNWVGSERWRYIWNRDNIPDLLECSIQPKHAS